MRQRPGWAGVGAGDFLTLGRFLDPAPCIKGRVCNQESPQAPSPQTISSPHSSLFKGTGSFSDGGGESGLATSVD